VIFWDGLCRCGDLASGAERRSIRFVDRRPCLTWYRKPPYHGGGMDRKRRLPPSKARKRSQFLNERAAHVWRPAIGPRQETSLGLGGARCGGRLRVRPQCLFRLLNLTPGPPPFSMMNSTPALSRVRWTASRFLPDAEGTPTAFSMRCTVEMPMSALSASSWADHRRRARAALI
jgi:hypothetical protein